MKTITKSILAGAVALALVTVGTSQAQAGGWPIAAGVVGGLAVGTAVGAAVANSSAPAYYGYPGTRVSGLRVFSAGARRLLPATSCSGGARSVFLSGFSSWFRVGARLPLRLRVSRLSRFPWLPPVTIRGLSGLLVRCWPPALTDKLRP